MAGTRVALMVGVLATLAFGACSGGSKQGGPPILGVDKPQSVSVFRLGAGTCLVGPQSGEETEIDASITALDAVPCSDPHRQEVFERATFDADEGYPGIEELDAFAQAACVDSFDDYTGEDYLDSTLFVTYLLPSLKSWTEANDHDVVCIATTTGVMVTGSAASDE